MAGDPEELRRRLEADPTDEQAFVGLQALYIQGGYQAELAELLEYRATYGLEGGPAGTLFVRAAEIWLDQVGDKERGATALTRAVEKSPMVQGAVDRLDALFRERGDTAALMQLFEKQLEALERLNAGDASSKLRAHYNQQLGEIWSQVYDRQDQAVSYFRRAFELDPKNVMALYCAREIYQQLGNHETAAKLLDLEARAENDGTRRVALYRELAHARAERLGDLEGAVVALKRALAIESSNPDVMGELALLLLRRAPLGGGDNDRIRAAELLYQVAALSSGETALGYCEAALDAWPENETALTLFEQTCHETGRLDLLADRYRRLVEPLVDSPLLGEVYRKAGHLATELNELEEAVAYFEGVLPLGEPADKEALIELYRRTGRGPQLTELLATEFGLSSGLPKEGPAAGDPEALPRLRELAELLRAQGRDDEAEARMVEILEIDPGDPEATSFLERRYRQRNDFAALYHLLSNAGASQRLSVAARVVRLREAAGIAEERLNDVDGAITAYKLATILEPGDPELPHQLERLLTAWERWDELVDRIEAEAARAETTQDKVEMLRRIGDVHWRQREDTDDAADSFQRILELVPDDAGALTSLDDLYQQTSDWENLATILQRREMSAATGQEKADLGLRLAMVFHESLERNEEAFAACRQVLEHIPDCDEALRRMEAIDTKSGNWKRLIETLRYRADVTEGEVSMEFLSRAASAAEAHLEDFEFAAGLWQQVVDLSPHDIEALTSKARCLERAGRWEEALEGLTELAEASDDSGLRIEARRRIAQVLEERGSREEAAQAWQEVIQEGEDPEALEALAFHYEERSEYTELVETLKRLAVVLEEPEHLGRVLLAEARTLSGPLELPDEAIEILDRVLKDIDPKSRDALRLLRRIYVDKSAFDLAVDAAEREIVLTENAAARTELLLTCASWYRIKLNDAQKAIDANERVLEIDPYRTDVLAALEELYVEVEDWERLLQLIRARYKASNDEDQKKQLLIAGADICETQLRDGSRAWGWFRELFDVYGHQPEILAMVETAANRHGLARELVGVYGELAKRAETDLKQAEWWKKIGTLYADPIGDLARSLEALLRGFALDPADQELLATIDDYSVRTGAHDRLTRVYDALVERTRDPGIHAALRRRAAAVLLRPEGDASLAFSQLLEAIQIVPENDELLNELETAADASGRWEELLKIYERRHEIAQSEGERIEMVLRAAQVVQEHLNVPDRAFGLVIEAVALDPDDEHVATRSMQIIDGLERQAGARVRGRYWRQLTSYYRDLINKYEEKPEEQVVYLEWIARIQQDHIQDGRAAFETRKEATLLFPGHTPSLVALERLAQRLDMWSDLALHYKDALEIVLDRDAAIDLHRRRARVLTEELKREAEAIEHYWQLIQIDPNDNETRGKLSRIYEKTGRWNDLMLLLEKEIPLADEERQKQILLRVAGIWESKVDNTYEAIDAYRRVLSKWPEDSVAHRGIERLQVPSKQRGSLDDNDLAALGLLDDAEPPVFEDSMELEPEVEEMVKTEPQSSAPPVVDGQYQPVPDDGSSVPMDASVESVPLATFDAGAGPLVIDDAPPPSTYAQPENVTEDIDVDEVLEAEEIIDPDAPSESLDVIDADDLVEMQDDEYEEIDSMMLELEPEGDEAVPVPQPTPPPVPMNGGKTSKPPPVPKK